MRNWDILMGELVGLIFFLEMRNEFVCLNNKKKGDRNNLCSFEIDDC